MSTQVNYGNILTEILMSSKELSYIENLINELPENGLVVEWGSGGSTCRWIEKLSHTQKLITIEHSESWHSRVQRAIKNHFGDSKNNFELMCVKELYSTDHAYATPMEEFPIGADDYINPNDSIWDANIYIIDGIARGACCISVLLNHKKPNPVILLKDYVGRENWYNWACQFFNIEVIGETTARLTIKGKE
jgi:hypothetical protein